MTETQTPTVSEGQKAFTVVLDHEYGLNATVHTSHTTALAYAAKFVRDYWHEVAGGSTFEGEDVPPDAPDDDAEAVRLYFASRENERCDIAEVVVQS
jgi:hypothetical protein